MRRILLAGLVLLAAPAALPAQAPQLILPKASPRATVSQTVGLTDISITYDRPGVNGRPIWGALVPWDSVWHPGADSATRMTFNHDVMIEGQKVEAGEYSLWLIPRQSAPWTLILSRAAHVFHKPYPGSSLDALRVPVTPEQVSHVEALAIYFPTVLRDKATMRIHWGETAVSVRIEAPYQPAR